MEWGCGGGGTSNVEGMEYDAVRWVWHEVGVECVASALSLTLCS